VIGYADPGQKPAVNANGGYIGYAMWRRDLALARGYTASHKDGIVKYTASRP
jgi:hypothetical protein